MALARPGETVAFGYTGNTAAVAPAGSLQLLAVEVERPARPARETIAFIKRIAGEIVLWGALRIHGGLLKLGFEISESTVAKYMPRIRPRRASPSWRTFLSGQMNGIAVIDLLTVLTVNYQELCSLVVIGLNRRRLLLPRATSHPTARWLIQQINEPFPLHAARRYPIRDNDRKFGHVFQRRLDGCGISDPSIAPRSP